MNVSALDYLAALDNLSDATQRVTLTDDIAVTTHSVDGQPVAQCASRFEDEPSFYLI
jgi:hypothetical protein